MLLDTKEDLLDPITRFMNGEQRKIYDNIKIVVNSNSANISYVSGDEFDMLKTLIDSKTPYKGNAIQLAKAAKDSLNQKITATLEKEKQEAIEVIERIISEFEKKEEYQQLNREQQISILKPFKEEIKKLEHQRFIAVVKDIKYNVENELYTRQLNAMIRLSSPPVEEQDQSSGAVVSEPKPHYITMTGIKPDFPKSELRTEEDVNEYIEAYRKKLLEQIKNNRRITI
jgi:hypothetical protein